jgi:hypothetical protein
MGRDGASDTEKPSSDEHMLAGEAAGPDPRAHFAGTTARTSISNRQSG